MAVGFFAKLRDFAKRMMPAVSKAITIAPKLIEKGQSAAQMLGLAEKHPKFMRNATRLRHGLETMQPIISRLSG